MRNGRPRTRALILTPDQKRQLEAWTRATTVPAVLARRSRVILLLAAGKPVRQIIPRVGLSRQGIYGCLRRFQQGGLAGLPRYVGGRPGEAPAPYRGKRRGRHRTFALVLTPEDRQQLEAWAQAQAGSQVLAQRSRLVLLVAAGETMAQVGDRVGRSRTQVYKWLRRFQQEGLAGLLSRPASGGRPRKEPVSGTS